MYVVLDCLRNNLCNNISRELLQCVDLKSSLAAILFGDVQQSCMLGADKLCCQARCRSHFLNNSGRSAPDKCRECKLLFRYVLHQMQCIWPQYETFPPPSMGAACMAFRGLAEGLLVVTSSVSR